MPIFRALLSRRAFAYASVAAATSAAGGYYYLNSGPSYPPSTVRNRRPPPPWIPPSRKDMLDALRASSAGGEHEFDLLIVGGGATGAGVAVDAATRGLKVALVERDDFSSGTSSKSTKLVHGGVRYLQKAVMELDYEQYRLVKEALHERRIFLETAPYLSHMLPIMLPVYKYWQVPYYWAGCKLYDILAGKENMESSYIMSKGKALEAFPMLKQEGLVGAIVYYDGQHNDSRMNMALIMTAVRHGAIVANHVEVSQLEKDQNTGKLKGAVVKDVLTGKSWPVRARGIINATGPFADSLLALDNPEHQPIVAPAAGVHITLPNYYAPRNMGLLDPATSDGRVIFFLPWQGSTIAGTTDSPCAIEPEPRPREEDVDWVLDEVRHYLSPDIKVRRGDVLSAWSGIRPLVRNPNAARTEGLVRNHIVHVSPSGLLTIAGGKWTTYRKMAEETVDRAVETFSLQDRAKSGCVTEKVHLDGSDGWTRNQFIGLVQRYGVDADVARHLSENYGDRAWSVCALAAAEDEQSQTDTTASWPISGVRLVQNADGGAQYPFIEAEVRYAVRHEYAQTAVDVLARRTRLAFLDAHAALHALPRVVEILSEELGWDARRRRKELERGVGFLRSMGLAYLPSDAEVAKSLDTAPHSFFETLRSALSFSPRATATITPATAPEYTRSHVSSTELSDLRSAFNSHADSNTTRLPASSLKPLLLSLGEDYAKVRDDDVRYVLAEAGLDARTDYDFHEFVEICTGLREILFRPSLVKKQVTGGKKRRDRMVIPVEKSGGGV
ncbi:DAO-domain-containing protein [Fomitiporia mediterranea MF3/22]|uniref:DAO-domain-containing protein n=1 Tax=Fomitiporia mediterranea (strain MF3/22) TaxID=694068 RepID=UPI00044092DC|nr:DAO-domain-containing protein [Fomitiporia mediterranea MF3/22]EJC98962.1 DAO-domain-containing protein [Fomitiporia mediterranea MF3/22]